MSCVVVVVQKNYSRCVSRPNSSMLTIIFVDIVGMAYPLVLEVVLLRPWAVFLRYSLFLIEKGIFIFNFYDL